MEDKKNHHILKTIMKCIGILLIVLVIVIGLLSFLPRVIGWQTANVVSGSMEPAIPVGSLVIADTGNYEELSAGDVIMFSSGESVITHRVVANDSIARTVITKGDANPREDMNPIPYYQIEGIVKFHIPVAGYLLQMLNTLTGKLCAVGVVVLGLLLILTGGRQKKQAE